MTASVRRLVALGAILLGLTPGVHAQGLTGQMSGSVVDTSQAVLPGASVTVTNAGTQAARTVNTDANGLFTVTDLLAGTYEVTVSLSGFKTYVQSGVVLSANERVALRPIALRGRRADGDGRGDRGSGPRADAELERSGLITQEQLKEVTLKGRDYMGMLALLPGVVDTQNREAPGWNNIGGLSHQRRPQQHHQPDLRRRDEPRHRIEYGAVPRARPGLDRRDQSADLELSGRVRSQLRRHDQRRHQERQPRLPRRRLLLEAVRGLQRERVAEQQERRPEAALPVRLQRLQHRRADRPAVDFNSGRNKLFFFWNQEFLPRTDPGTLQLRNVPTELERRGDFSRSFDNNGKLIVIRDPTTGQPFPNNIIPANRIDPNGQALLNLFPVPNAIDPQRQYNYTFQSSYEHPRNDQVLRVDWNVGAEHDVLFAAELRLRGVQGRMGLRVEQRQLAAAADRLRDPQLRHRQHPAPHVQPDARRWSDRRPQSRQADGRTADPGGSGAQRPDAGGPGEPAAVLPGGEPVATSSPTPASARPAWRSAQHCAHARRRRPRIRSSAQNDIWNSSANLTKVAGAHNMKAGLFFEHTTRPAARSSTFNGSFNFDRNTAIRSTRTTRSPTR